MAHDHRCVQTRPETEIGRHGAMLWIVVKIAAFKVEQPFVLELQERHKQASARVRVPLARIALPLQPVTFTAPVGQGQQLSFAPVLLQV